MKFFHVPEKLPDLIGLGLAPAALQVERAGGVGMLINMVAPLGPVQAVTKCLDHLAEIRKANILGADQQLFINLTRTHKQ